jgi:hypothetical protein
MALLCLRPCLFRRLGVPKTSGFVRLLSTEGQPKGPSATEKKAAEEAPDIKPSEDPRLIEDDFASIRDNYGPTLAVPNGKNSLTFVRQTLRKIQSS